MKRKEKTYKREGKQKKKGKLTSMDSLFFFPLLVLLLCEFFSQGSLKLFILLSSLSLALVLLLLVLLLLL